MFGKLFGRGAQRPEADPYALPVPRRQKNGMYTLHALGDTRVLALVEAAEAGEWQLVRESLAPFDLGHDDRVLGELARLEGVQDWIGRAAQEDKEHRATALLISGARHIDWGWEARTFARAANVTQEQWRVFHERLRIAEEHLFEAAELRPEWITPWRRLLTSGRGMSLGRAVNETRRDAALRRDPLDLDTHVEWVQQLQPRWGGEPGEALAFAQNAYGPSCGKRPTTASSTRPTCGARAGSRTSTCSPWPCRWPASATRYGASSRRWTAPTPSGPGSTSRSRRSNSRAGIAAPEHAPNRCS
jgi:hypothetical protein